MLKQCPEVILGWSKAFKNGGKQNKTKQTNKPEKTNKQTKTKTKKNLGVSVRKGFRDIWSTEQTMSDIVCRNIVAAVLNVSRYMFIWN